jgi:homeobox-leucine zipper protein
MSHPEEKPYELRAESIVKKEAMTNPICSNCGGPIISLEEQQIRAENARLKEIRAEYARLKEELAQLCALAKKFLEELSDGSSPTVSSA